MGEITDWWPILALPLGWLFSLISDLKKEIAELREEKNEQISDVRDDMSKIAENVVDASATISQRLDNLLLELFRSKK